MKKLYERDSQLLQRKRIAFEIPHENKPTPKKEDIKKQIASELNIDESLIVMKHVYTDYGEHKSKAIVNVYKDANILKKLDAKKVKKVNENAEKKEKTKETK